MIIRRAHLDELLASLKKAPVVGILGGRQVGKTTLARQVAAAWGRATHWFDLEDARDAARLQDPLAGLEGLQGLVVLDEIQHAPKLYQALRVLADRPMGKARFLILGSAAPSLLKQAAESLAGRIHYHRLGGFSGPEIKADLRSKLWLRGGYPRSLLASTGAESFRRRLDLMGDYLQRDLPDLGFQVPAATLRRFWGLLAHNHAQVLNLSELGRAFGMSEASVRRYCELLSDTFMLRLLPAWHENLSKRQVKAPKVYLRDSGLLHVLLDIREQRDLEGHLKVGSSWEGFALEEVLRHPLTREREAYFWATHQGAELDLLLVKGRQRVGFEFKRNSAPGLTPSMGISMKDLKLDRLWVIHPGKHRFTLGKGIEALPLGELDQTFGKRRESATL